MALPDTLELREIKYGEKTTNELRVTTGELFLREGRLAEALELFILADDQNSIARMRELAQKNGLPWLLVSLRRDGHEVTPDHWLRAGEAAEAAGRWRDGFRAYTEAEDEDALARVREKIPGYDFYVPQGK